MLVFFNYNLITTIFVLLIVCKLISTEFVVIYLIKLLSIQIHVIISYLKQGKLVWNR